MSSLPRRRVPAGPLLWLAAAALIVLPVGLLQAQSRVPDEPIVGVRVEGNETIPSAVILQHTTIKSGRVVTDREMLDDVRSLYETKWFSRVQREVRRTEAGPIVVFKVKELPQVASVRYLGNDKKSDEQLSRVTGLEPGSPYRVMFNRDAAEQLRRYYVEEGYRHAKVSLERGDTENHRDVVFRIEEGPKVRVASINFEGNQAFSASLLKRDLETKTKVLGLVPLFGLFDPTTVPRDVAALTDYYRDLGYFDVKVEAELSESDDRADVHVTFSIEEGVRYRVRNVILVGNEKLSDATLMADPKLKPGDPYNARFLQADRQAMEKLYGKEGRLFTRILPTPDFLDEPGVIDLKYEIEEDKVRYIRYFNASVAGDHPHTQVSLLHNISMLHPGDKADPDLIRITDSRIKGNPAFGPDSSLEVRPVEEEPVQPAGHFRGQSPDGSSAPEYAPAPRGERTTPAGRATLDRRTGYLQPRPAPLNALPVRTASLTTSARPRRLDQLGDLARATAPAGPATPQTDPAAWLPDDLFTFEKQALTRYWEPTTPEFAATCEPLVTPVPKQPFRVPEIDPFAPIIRAQSPAPQTSPINDGWNASEDPVFVAAAPAPPVTTADGEYNPFQTVQQTGGEFGPGVSNPLLPQSPNGGPFQGPFEEPPGYVDIYARGTEQRTGRIMVGAAVNSSSGLVGQFTIQEDNFDLFRFPRSFQELRNGTAFRGRGQRLRIEAVPGAQVSRYLISLSDPYFLDSLYSAGVSGFYYSRFYEEFDEQRLGGRLTLGRQLTPFWSIMASSRLEEVKIFDPIQPTPPKLVEALGDNLLITAGLTLRYDGRDRAIQPSEGTYAEVGYTQGFGDFTYPRLDVEGARYWTLAERPDGTGKHVLSARGAVGIAGDDLPIFESYYLGGFQTLRGFDFRGVSPKQNGVRVGGRFSTYGSVQYRFPILVNDALQGVVFSDFGTVNQNVKFDDIRASVGAGVRVSLPQAFGPAPLAFDLAFPVLGPDGDEEQIFSFNIGIYN